MQDASSLVVGYREQSRTPRSFSGNEMAGLRVRRLSNSSVGMTLIEIMIVVALIALLTGTLIFGSGFFSGANRRAAATLIVVGVRKGLAHANTTGKPVRLAIDLEGDRIVLEESSSRVALRKDKDADEEEERDYSTDLLADAEAAAEKILSGTSAPRASFSPIDVLGQDGESPGRALGKGVGFVKVQTEHDRDGITEGLAHIYFWPGGVTERAVIQIARKSDESGITVVISALTGRAQIKRGLIDLPEGVGSDDDEFSEREEP